MEVKSWSSVNDNGHHPMRHRTHTLIFPKHCHSNLGKTSQMLLKYLDTRRGMMIYATDASEDEVAFSQLGVGVTGRLKSGLTLIQQGKMMRGQVPGTCWELSIWWVRRERWGRIHTREGKAWKNRENWTDHSGPTCFMAAAPNDRSWGQLPKHTMWRVLNLGIMDSELRTHPPLPKSFLLGLRWYSRECIFKMLRRWHWCMVKFG